MCFEEEEAQERKTTESHLASGRIYIFIYGGLFAQLLTYLPTSFISFISIAFFHDEPAIILDRLLDFLA